MHAFFMVGYNQRQLVLDCCYVSLDKTASQQVTLRTAVSDPHAGV